MQPFRNVFVGLAVSIGMFALADGANAQDVPWTLFQDPISASACDVINAANSELLLLRSTGQLVIVSGADIVLQDTFVDADGFVFFEGDQVGLINFEEDGDGFRTLWWLSLTGRVVDMDGFTGEPFETNSVPTDFFDVPCDGCDFWDDQSVCVVVDVPVTVSICGLGVPVALGMSLVGLSVVGVIRRRTFA